MQEDSCIHNKPLYWINPLNAELNLICHLLASLGGATIVVVSRLRVKYVKKTTCFGLLLWGHLQV